MSCLHACGTLRASPEAPFGGTLEGLSSPSGNSGRAGEAEVAPICLVEPLLNHAERSPIRKLELPQNRGDMRANGDLRDVQPGGDLPRRLFLSEELEDLPLAARQLASEVGRGDRSSPRRAVSEVVDEECHQPSGDRRA